VTKIKPRRDEEDKPQRHEEHLRVVVVHRTSVVVTLGAYVDLFFAGTGIPAIFTFTEKSVLLVVK
jgi:hypothetical protein